MLTRKKALVNDKVQDKDDKAGSHETDTPSSIGTQSLPQPPLIPSSITEQTKRSPATQKRPLIDSSCSRQRSKRQRRDTGVPNKPGEVWSDDDKDVFFQALQEFGKDFDKIHRHIVQKVKNRADAENKTRDQVRHFYYRTWRGLEKCIQFGEGVDKAAAELFGLINYSELRKKLGTKNGMNGKNAEKLRELIHCGSTTVKVGGKKIRLKTPTCRALKKLFKIADDKIVRDKVKVPEYVLIDLQPRDAHAWTYVHMMAHNPHVLVKVKSKQTLSQLLEFMQKKWVPHRVRLRGQYKETETPLELRLYPLTSAKLKDYTLKATKPCAAKRVDLNVDSYLSTVVGKTRPDQAAADPLSINVAADDHDPNSSSKSAASGAPVGDIPAAAAAVGTAGAVPSCLGTDPVSCSVGQLDKQTVGAALCADSCHGERPGPMSVPEKLNVLSQVSSVAVVDGEGAPPPGSGSSDDTHTEHMKELARHGWTLATCSGITIAELYLLIGSSEKVTLEYTWQTPATSTSKLLAVEDLTAPCKAAAAALKKLAQLARNENTDLARKSSTSPSVTKDVCSPSTRHKGRGVRPAAAPPSLPLAVAAANAATGAVVVALPPLLVTSTAASTTGSSEAASPALPVQAVHLPGHSSGAVCSTVTADGALFRIPVGPGLLRPDSMATRPVSISSLSKVPMVTNRNVRNKIIRKPLLVQRTLLPSSQAVFCVVPVSSAGGASSVPALHASAPKQIEPGDVLSAAMKASGVGIFTAGSTGEVGTSHRLLLPGTDAAAGKTDVVSGAITTGAAHQAVTDLATAVPAPSSASVTPSVGSDKRRITPMPVLAANSSNLELTPFALASSNHSAMSSQPASLDSAPAGPLHSTPAQMPMNNRDDMDIGNSESSLFLHESSLLLGAAVNGSSALSFTGLIGSKMKPSSAMPEHETSAQSPAKEWLTADVSLGDFSLSSLLASSGEKSPEKHLFEASAVPSANALDDSSRMSFLSKFDVQDVADMTVDNALNTLMTESSVDYISKFEDLANHLSLDTPRKRPAEN